MTIKECIKKHGYQSDHVDFSKPYRSMTVDVGFINNGMDDETEFDINAYDTDELSQLYSDFCKENHIPENTVNYVVIVETNESKL